jgi:TRAP-type C4-dicarboxylate transport system permease small subunit
LTASSWLLVAERVLIMSLMSLLTALILINVATRYSGFPIYWIDEASVFAMVWLSFIGASAMTRLRLDFAVTLLTEKLPERAARIARVAATSLVILFAVSLAAMCWIWMDPVGIAQAGFDARDYAGLTFNFLYTERTQTLNWPTWILFLILPIFALSMAIHALANLAEDLRLVPPASHSGFRLSNAEAVN